ncbi:molybdopterin-dependent oxidoreductase [Microbispora bryophytorum]|uniref:molybdopterin-dependent oxidoreductase n=1 Tax=Microbispora bryophytorum TaxID=1460882 RepID=UPI0033E1B326
MTASSSATTPRPPRLDARTWTLRVEGGGVRHTVRYTYDDLWRRFPLVSVVRTLECAGNRRALFDAEHGHRFDGVQWGRGAIGTAEWTGIPLRDLLEPAGLTDAAVEVMPEGLDEPDLAGAWTRWRFPWDPTPGAHVVRVRATDERGRSQPDTTPWNDLGYCHTSVLPHPVLVA